MVNTADDGFWLRLDNAAKIFPAVQGKELTAVFRISAELKQAVRIRPFLEAIRAVENRFPYYKVGLKTGFFWYYLEQLDLPVRVLPDLGLPCRAFGHGELMFRVLVRDRRISVEFSHILTDGSGGFEFLKTVLLAYFEICGSPVSPNVHYCRPGEEPAEEEFEDAYLRYFRKVRSSKLGEKRAFHLPFRLGAKPRFDLLTAVASLEEVAAKAKESGVSITEYLVAVFLFALQGVFENLPARAKRRAGKLLQIEVPVNLRKLFPSRTMRNFSLFVKPGIDLRLGYYSFEEILKMVFHQMRLETDKKLIHKMISRNVGGEKNPFVRVLPLFLKSFFLSRIYAINTRSFSSVLTNYGKAELPPRISEQIEKFIFIPPPPNKKVKINCGVIGFEEKLILCFGNLTVSKELERRFLTFLTENGISVKIKK